MARLRDFEHPFFRPLWRRIAVVAACAVWTAVEYAGGSSTWALIALAVTAYGAWQFFYLYKPVDESVAPDDKDPEK
jgi:hypothetical protein